MARNENLTDEVKEFIVCALASFDGVSRVAAAVKEEFGIEMSVQNVQNYDPTKTQGRKLSSKLTILFHNARREFIDDTSKIPISHRATRLRTLQRMAEKAEEKNQFALVASLNKQAAEEMGNAFTNRREISGPGGGPIQTEDKTDLAILIEEAKRLGIDPATIGLA